MENKEQTGMILEEAAKDYAECKSSSSVFQEAHIADFKAGALWHASQPINSELTQLKAENERLKAEMVLFEAMKEYARIRIEKDRAEIKRLMNEKLKDFEGLNPKLEEIFDTAPINLD